MESSCIPGRIQISKDTHNLLLMSPGVEYKCVWGGGAYHPQPAAHVTGGRVQVREGGVRVRVRVCVPVCACVCVRACVRALVGG